MACKNKCDLIRVYSTKQRNHTYSKFCRECQSWFLKDDSVRCPCCNKMMRAGAKNKKMFAR